MGVGSDDSGKGAQIAARDDNRKLALLVAIKRIPKPTEKDLIEATNIPKRCVHSMIKSLSKMSVVIERVNGRRHGYYTIADEGAFNLERAPSVLQDNYPDVFQQIEVCAVRKEEETHPPKSVSNVASFPESNRSSSIPVSPKYIGTK